MLGKKLTKLELRIDNNKKHLLELVSKIGEEVSLNTLFDSMDQIVTMCHRDGQELLSVAMSITTGILDLATEREKAGIIDGMMDLNIPSSHY